MALGSVDGSGLNKNPPLLRGVESSDFKDWNLLRKSIAPLGAVGRAVDVLPAYFPRVFVVVVLHGGGVRCVVARGRSCANDGTATVSVDVYPTGIGLR